MRLCGERCDIDDSCAISFELDFGKKKNNKIRMPSMHYSFVNNGYTFIIVIMKIVKT